VPLPVLPKGEKSILGGIIMDKNYDDSNNVYTVIIDGLFRGNFATYTAAFARADDFMSLRPGNPQFLEAEIVERFEYADGFTVHRRCGDHHVDIVSAPVRH
jgi:hypothetical protein